MAITNGYCTVAEAKAQLWPADAPVYTTEDTTLERMISFASRKIDNDTNRRFWVNSVDETRYYNAEKSNYSRIYIDDLVSITTLKADIDMDRVYETTFATTDYDLMPENAPLLGQPYTFIQVVPLNVTGRYFPKQPKGVQLVGKFGWSAVPDEIKEACLIKVQIEYWIKNGFGGVSPKQTIDTLEKRYQDIIVTMTKYWAK